MQAGSAHAVDLADRDEIARLLRHADAVSGQMPLVDGLADQIKLLLRGPPHPDQVELSDVQRLLELHRDLLPMWRALGRDLARQFTPELRASPAWQRDSKEHIKLLAEVSTATGKLTASLIALQASADRAYGTATEEELERQFTAEVLRMAARIPDDTWRAMVDRRAGR